MAALAGLLQSTWAVNGRVEVTSGALSAMYHVRDDLRRSGDAQESLSWIESALEPGTYGGDALIYLRRALADLPPSAAEVDVTLRWLISEMEGE